MSTPYPQIGLIFVLFNPLNEDIDFVGNVSKVYNGIIVDNSTIPSFNKEHINLMRYVCLGKNTGIAHAQNVGYDYLLKNTGVNFIVLLDQDSRFPESYPADIIEQYCNIKSKFVHLGALGPSLYIKWSEEKYHSVIHHDHFLTRDFIVRPEVISSGCCIDRDTVIDVGFNDEALFIDFVDTEWCFRAESKGYICGISPHVKLQHKVGREEIHIGQHIVSVSAPFRYKYQFRNYFILLKRTYVPFWFKRNWGIKLFLRYIYLPFCIKNGFKTWLYMNIGVFSGLKKLFSRND